MSKLFHHDDDACDGAVKRGFGQLSGLDRFAETCAKVAIPSGNTDAIPGHFHVESCLDAGVGGLCGKPVGHHKAAKAHFLPQGCFKESTVFAAIRAVDFVVGSHHGTSASIDGCGECREVDFVQGAFIDEDIYPHPALFEVIRGKVFDGGDEAILLNAFDLCGDKGGGEEWIFPEGLEVTSGTGLSHDIDHRGEEDILAESAAFFANGGPKAAGDVRVERGSH